MSDTVKVMQKCEVCDSSVQFGPQRYCGKFIQLYGLFACDDCLKGNWDGWGPVAEVKILAHLHKHGIAIPPRNKKGWLPLE
jgi:hypothetical protein